MSKEYRVTIIATETLVIYVNAEDKSEAIEIAEDNTENATSVDWEVETFKAEEIVG